MDLSSLLQSAGLSISSEVVKKLEHFGSLFLEKNEEINLISRFASDDDFLVKHLVDSLMIASFLGLSPGMEVADVGTGGGLPGIPLAILYPEVQFILMDSVEKKLIAVEEFADRLALKNINTVAERLEVVGQNPHYRERFDRVVARALAPLPTLLELCIPLVKKGGQFASLKGPGYLEEIDQAHNAMKQLKLDYPLAERYELPNEGGKRFVLLFEKTKPTPPQYPRRVGMAKKRPL